jgi:hypothetical protein
MRVRRLAVVLALIRFVAGAPLALAEPRVIDLAVHEGRLPEDRRVVQVRQGDSVTLRWSTDRRLTFHVHGYDLEDTVSPEAPAVVRFIARATGRFPIEIHGPDRGSERTIGYLEVHPR